MTLSPNENYILFKLDAVVDELRAIHKSFRSLEKKIMATQAELTAKLGEVNEKLVKIGGETSTLLAKIEELKLVIANGPVSAELQAAVDAVAAQAGVVDDMVPDVPPTPMPPVSL